MTSRLARYVAGAPVRPLPRSGLRCVEAASLLVTPLYPLGRDMLTLLDLNSPRDVRECYHVPAPGAELPDVREGDILSVGGQDYIVFYVAEWPDGDVPALNLVLQKVKGT